MTISVSLVIETNNLEDARPHVRPCDLHGRLHGATAPETRVSEADPPALRVTQSLEELLVHLRGQTRSLASLTELVVTHEELSPEHEARLARAAGRAITFVRVPVGTTYYAAKNRGFEATTADVVAFGDADCWPDDAWLARLVAPFEDPGVQAVAGRTSYRDDLLGAAATTIDFMYFTSSLGARCTRNFYANNVAFRRATFESARYLLDDAFYRGNCQVLGLALQARGVPVIFEPAARTTHRFPDSVTDFVRLRLLRGADAVELTPHLARAYLPARLRPLARLPGLEALVLGSRLAFSLRAINHQDMRPARGARLAACAGLVAGISALDAAGACLKRAGLGRLVARGEAGAAALAYHANVDALSSVAA